MDLSGAAFSKVANLNLAYGAESGVDALPPTAAGFHDVFGSLWQVGGGIGQGRGAAGQTDVQIPAVLKLQCLIAGHDNECACLDTACWPSAWISSRLLRRALTSHALPPLPLTPLPACLQWCEDRIASLPRSRGVHPLYDDFTTPCYDGEHQVILGGSFASTGDEASVFARRGC
jgi:hypothetical protein